MTFTVRMGNEAIDQITVDRLGARKHHAALAMALWTLGDLTVPAISAVAGRLTKPGQKHIHQTAGSVSSTLVGQQTAC